MYLMYYFFLDKKATCTESCDMQISDAVGGAPQAGAEPCRFPKLEECAHFHYERVQLQHLSVCLKTSMDQSLHSQHSKFACTRHSRLLPISKECDTFPVGIES